MSGEDSTGIPQGNGPGNREIIEALLFATDEPLTVRQIVDIFGMLEEGEKPTAITPDDVLGSIEDLNRAH